MHTIHTVMTSTQREEPGGAPHSEEVEGYTGEESTASSMTRMNKLIVSEVIVKSGPGLGPGTRSASDRKCRLQKRSEWSPCSVACRGSVSER